ncbi:MAG: MopE-related protein, partial [Myxococcota bacterium]
TFFADTDGDGFGEAGSTLLACDVPAGYADVAGDCAPADATSHPGATEACDAVDNDCDGTVDDHAVGTAWYADADEDGYGDPADVIVSCDAPAMYVGAAGDCDDADPVRNPGAVEVCGNGEDENCSDLDDCRDDGAYAAATHAVTTWTGVNGSTATSSFGSRLVGDHDFDGDGIADLAVGDRLYDASSSLSNMGRVTIFAGTGAGFTDTVANPTVTITGADAAGRFGQGLAAGDLDGDGIDDLIVGTPAVNGFGGGSSALTDNGKAAVFLGPFERGTGGATTALTSTAAADCTVEGAAARSYLGNSVAFGGDLTGDGAADWAYGAYQSHSTTTAGYVGIVSTSTCSSTLSSSGTIHTIAGSAGDYFGLSVLGDLDLDGDGEDDLLVAAGGTDAVYAFLGPVTATTRADADAAITGMDFFHSTSSPEDLFGDRIAPVGDTDGDGYAEFLVGANSYDVGGNTSAGAAFLFSGDTVVLAGSDTAGALAEVAVLGGATSYAVGQGVSRAGDVDADGREDFLVGIGGDTVGGVSYGAVALFYGGATGTYSPSFSTTPDGFALYDTEATTTSAYGSGGAVAPLGDADGDGFDDFVFANMNYGTTRVGRVYMVVGAGE